jgi:HK97 family phage major capsid protein
MKRSDELKQEHLELLDRAEALHASMGDNPTETQVAEFNRLIDAGKEVGEKTEKAIRTEENVRAMRASKQSLLNPQERVFDATGGGGYVDQSDWMARQVGGRVNLINPGLKAFNGGGNREQAQRDAYDSGLWFKATILKDGDAREKLEARRGPSWVASQNESSPVDGGYLVPNVLQNAIIVSREQIGAVRKLATIFPMTSDNLQIPKETGNVSVYYPGEEGEITPSDADFARAALVPKKRAVLTYVSNELRDDAIIPIMDHLAQGMGHALGLKEDQEGIVGDGTSTYGGVRGIRPAVIAATAGVFTASVGDHDAWSELTYADFAGTMSLLPDRFRVQGQLAWLCSAPFKWQVMDRLTIGANGAPSQAFIDGVPIDMFLGYPIVLSDRMPTATAASQVCCIFGNFGRAVAMGERSGVRIAISEHVAFTSDRLAVRATTRYDINVHEAGDTSAAGALVGLSTNS